MSTRRRIAITAASALALAVTTVGLDWSQGVHAAQVWGIGMFAAWGLALVGIFFVNRWWALLPALTTVAAGWLGSMIYQPTEVRYEVVNLPLGIWVLIVLFEIVGTATFLSVGLLARRIWDHFRRPNVSTATPRGNVG